MPTIRKRNGRWQAQIRLKDDGVIVYQESATFDTERQATLWGNAQEARVLQDGIDKHRKSRVTVLDLIAKYQSYREGLGDVSKGVQHSLSSLSKGAFATKVVSAVTAKDLVDWGTMKAKTLAPATVMHHFMVLRAIYATASSLSQVEPDMAPLLDAISVLKRMRLMAKSQSRERRVTDDELDQIELHLKSKFVLIPTDVFIRLAVAFPRRREELLTMTWSDYKGDTVLLRDTKNKTHRRDEIVPVPPKARAIIDSLPRVPGEDRILPYKPESVSAAFQRAVRAVGLADIRLHDLRHEGISRLFDAGLGIQDVALISGHTSWAALRRYTHIKPTDVLEKLKNGNRRPEAT